MKESFIYVVETPDRRYVKFGITTNPRQRFANIRCWARDLFGGPEITIVGVFRGGWDEEQSIHRRLSAFAFEHEWFVRSSEVDAMVESLYSRFLNTEPVARWYKHYQEI